jgi:hypothetical protein
MYRKNKRMKAPYKTIRTQHVEDSRDPQNLMGKCDLLDPKNLMCKVLFSPIT